MKLLVALARPFRRIKLRHVIIAILLVIIAWRLTLALLPMSVADVLRNQARLNNTVVTVWGQLVRIDESYYVKSAGASLYLDDFHSAETDLSFTDAVDNVIRRVSFINKQVLVVGVYKRNGTPSRGYENILDVSSGKVVPLRGVKRFLVMHL